MVGVIGDTVVWTLGHMISNVFRVVVVDIFWTSDVVVYDVV
jgi:DNA-binding XRE family transcriptional regulator